MRNSDIAAQSVLPQAPAIGAELLRTIARRPARYARHFAGRLSLYVFAAVVGVTVVLLVMRAWLRIMVPIGR